MTTFTLTGAYKTPGGGPAGGTVEIIPSVKQIVDADGNVIFSGREKVKLDNTGHFTANLPDPNDLTLNPNGFGFTVVPKLHHTHLPAVSFPVPAGTTTIDMADITQVDPSTFTPGVTYVTPAELAAAVAGVVVDTSGLASAADVDALEAEVGGRLSESGLSATYVARTEIGDIADPGDVAGFLTEEAVTAELETRELVVGAIEDHPDVLVSIRDPSDVRTWLEANTTDGGPTPYSLNLLADALALEAAPTTTTYVADGDSMTGDAYGGGTTYPAKLAALLGETVVNQGSGGRRASEVAIVSGGLAFPIAIPGRTIPAATTTVAVTPTLPDSGPNADRTFTVSVQGVECTLTYTHATTSWTLARKVAAGAATAVPATGAVAIPVTAYSGAGYVHILWGGRNSTTDGAPAMLAAAAWMKESGTPFLLLGVTNSTAEPSGNSSYNNIIALNAELRDTYPREYVEIRGRLISEGLALAGLSATADDTTAISEDRIPPALLADGLHPNEAGRTAIAAIIHDELTIRGLA